MDGFVGWHLRLVVSVAVAIGAVAIALLIRRLRHLARERIRPIILDLVSSTLIAATVIAAGLLVAELWGQTETLLAELGILRLDARAPEVVITVVVIIAIAVFTGIVRRLLDDLATESGAITDHQREIGVRISQLTLWGFGIVVVLGVWDVDLTGILVGAGFLGIVLGLAARKTLGSLLAGLVLMFARPFEIGDWVVVDGHEGVVREITLVSTRIRSFNGERIVVPNDLVTGEIVVNRTREGRLRVAVPVGVDYDADLERAVDVAETTVGSIADEYDQIVGAEATDVIVTELADSAIELEVRAWVERPNRSTVTTIRHELIDRLAAAYDDAGIDIPFPQRTISERRSVDDRQPNG